MAANYYEVEVGLGNHLRTLTNLPPVAWEAVSFEPPRGLWLRPTMLTAEPNSLFVGAGITSQTRTGIYRIGVFAPTGTGIAAASQMADAIIDHFESSPVIPANGLNISVELAWRAPALTEPDWYQIPVSVRFNFIS